jgi:hypothetical protein
MAGYPVGKPYSIQQVQESEGLPCNYVDSLYDGMSESIKRDPKLTPAAKEYMLVIIRRAQSSRRQCPRVFQDRGMPEGEEQPAQPDDSAAAWRRRRPQTR